MECAPISPSSSTEANEGLIQCIEPTTTNENSHPSLNFNDLPDISAHLHIDLPFSSPGTVTNQRPNDNVTSNNANTEGNSMHQDHHMITRRKLALNPQLDPQLQQEIHNLKVKTTTHKAYFATHKLDEPKTYKTAKEFHIGKLQWKRKYMCCITTLGI